jgi:hypothetical protein
VDRSGRTKPMGISTVLRPDTLYMVQPYLQCHHMLFSEVAVGQSSNFRTLRPLCPTRWTVSVDAIQNVVCQYESVLDALEAFVEPFRGASAESKTSAKILQHSFGIESGSSWLRQLGESLYSTSRKVITRTIYGMLAAVDHTLKTVLHLP